ncbi:hypothetical protein J6590_050951 [Homalodisca vitripennis]|nr:hypothetical protein J6590_050951 [Homalodisca vitripennis]
MDECSILAGSTSDNCIRDRQKPNQTWLYISVAIDFPNWWVSWSLILSSVVEVTNELLRRQHGCVHFVLYPSNSLLEFTYLYCYSESDVPNWRVSWSLVLSSVDEVATELLRRQHGCLQVVLHPSNSLLEFTYLYCYSESDVPNWRVSWSLVLSSVDEVATELLRRQHGCLQVVLHPSNSLLEFTYLYCYNESDVPNWWVSWSLILSSVVEVTNELLRRQHGCVHVVLYPSNSLLEFTYLYCYSESDVPNWRVSWSLVLSSVNEVTTELLRRQHGCLQVVLHPSNSLLEFTYLYCYNESDFPNWWVSWSLILSSVVEVTNELLRRQHGCVHFVLYPSNSLLEFTYLYCYSESDVPNWRVSWSLVLSSVDEVTTELLRRQHGCLQVVLHPSNSLLEFTYLYCYSESDVLIGGESDVPNWRVSWSLVLSSVDEVTTELLRRQHGCVHVVLYPSNSLLEFTYLYCYSESDVPNWRVSWSLVLSSVDEVTTELLRRQHGCLQVVLHPSNSLLEFTYLYCYNESDVLNWWVSWSLILSSVVEVTNELLRRQHGCLQVVLYPSNSLLEFTYLYCYSESDVPNWRVSWSLVLSSVDEVTTELLRRQHGCLQVVLHPSNSLLEFTYLYCYNESDVPNWWVSWSLILSSVVEVTNELLRRQHGCVHVVLYPSNSLLEFTYLYCYSESDVPNWRVSWSLVLSSVNEVTTELLRRQHGCLQVVLHPSNSLLEFTYLYCYNESDVPNWWVSWSLILSSVVEVTNELLRRQHGCVHVVLYPSNSLLEFTYLYCYSESDVPNWRVSWSLVLSSVDEVTTELLRRQHGCLQVVLHPSNSLLEFTYLYCYNESDVPNWWVSSLILSSVVEVTKTPTHNQTNTVCYMNQFPNWVRILSSVDEVTTELLRRQHGCVHVVLYPSNSLLEFTYLYCYSESDVPNWWVSWSLILSSVVEVTNELLRRQHGCLQVVLHPSNSLLEFTYLYCYNESDVPNWWVSWSLILSSVVEVTNELLRRQHGCLQVVLYPSNSLLEFTYLYCYSESDVPNWRVSWSLVLSSVDEVTTELLRRQHGCVHVVLYPSNSLLEFTYLYCYSESDVPNWRVSWSLVLSSVDEVATELLRRQHGCVHVVLYPSE